jgi:hypothetical protein
VLQIFEHVAVDFGGFLCQSKIMKWTMNLTWISCITMALCTAAQGLLACLRDSNIQGGCALFSVIDKLRPNAGLPTQRNSALLNC